MKILALLLGFAITLAAQTPIKAPLLFEEQTAPGSPAANTASLYSKDNGGGTTQICMKDSAGTETCIGSGGGSCEVDTKVVWFGTKSKAGGLDEGGGLYQTAGGTADAIGGSDAMHVAYGEIHDGVVTAIHHMLEDCYTGENLTIEIIGTPPGTSTSGSGSFDVDYLCTAAGENWGAGATDTGTDITVDMSSDTVQDMLKYSQTFSVTGCAAGEIVKVIATYATGTLADDFRLVGMRIHN